MQASEIGYISVSAVPVTCSTEVNKDYELFTRASKLCKEKQNAVQLYNQYTQAYDVSARSHAQTDVLSNPQGRFWQVLMHTFFIIQLR